MDNFNCESSYCKYLKISYPQLIIHTILILASFEQYQDCSSHSQVCGLAGCPRNCIWGEWVGAQTGELCEARHGILAHVEI